MAVYKCKICGGDLEVKEGSEIAVCAYCGTRQALPKPDAEKEREKADIDSLLKRISLFLEDGDWASAKKYCERALDVDPENAKAYVGKLMAKMKIRTEAELSDCPDSFEDNDNYIKALRFADESYKSVLQGYNDAVAYRIEEARKEGVYTKASSLAETLDIVYLEKAVELFESISDYRDSAEKLINCKKKLEEVKVQREQERLEAEHAAAIQAERGKKNTKIAFTVVVIIIVFFVVLNAVIIPGGKYSEAVALMNDGKYDEAITAFEAAGNYMDAKDKIAEINILQEEKKNAAAYQQASVLLDAGKYDEAITAFTALGDYKDAKEKLAEIEAQLNEATYQNAMALLDDGKYIEAIAELRKLGDYKDAQAKLEQIRDMKRIIDISVGEEHTVCLKSDGTVIAIGYNYYGQCNVSAWTDIVAISASEYITVGLKSDGTVVATGENYYGQCDVNDWENIVAISASPNYTFGLRSDGTVVTTGENKSYNSRLNIGGWTDIVAISASQVHTVGLKSDGTVVAVGSNTDNKCDVSDWTDITAIFAGFDVTFGLKKDGTVLGVGSDKYVSKVSGPNISAISAGAYNTASLKSDGTVVVVGNNIYGQCNVSDWTGIVAIASSKYHTVGLKNDGTLVAVGSNLSGQCNVGTIK